MARMPWIAARHWSPPESVATGFTDMADTGQTDTGQTDAGTTDTDAGKLLADPYGDWAADQGVPVVEDFGVDLKTIETAPWPRLGSDGAIVHLKGQGDFVAIFLIDLAPGGQGTPQRHLIEEVVYVISGHGYSLLWYDGDEDFVRVDWEHGVVFAPPDMMFHQHFNTAPHPSRYLAAALGSLRYPLTADKRNLFGAGVDADVRKGGRQIEYRDQDPRIHQIYLAELAKHGVASAMGDYFDESRYEQAAG